MDCVPTIDTETISPERAAEYLARRAANQRALKPSLISRLADEMRAGAWKLNGDPIRFNVAGELIDGQHRLSAAIAAHFTLRSQPVIRGISTDAMTSIDRGKSRSMRDVFRIVGWTSDSARCGELAREALAREGRQHCSDHELMEVAIAHKDAYEWAVRLPHVRRLFGRGVRLALAEYHERAGSARASKFAELLYTGAGLPSGHPVLTLRNRLLTVLDSATEQHDKTVSAIIAYHIGVSLDRVYSRKWPNNYWPDVDQSRLQNHN